MNAWPVRAKIALAVSALLVVAGAMPVLSFAGLLGWQVVTLFQTGSWVPLPAISLFSDSLRQTAESLPPVIWILSRVHAGLVFALAGAAMIAAGVLRGLRQRAALRAQKQQKEDRLRRVQDYVSHDVSGDTLDGRREPFIASFRGMPAQRKA
jgi:hypothetical protein